MSSDPLNLDSLPNEILVHICSFLEARFVLDVVSRISQRFGDLISDDSLWKIRTKKRFNHSYPPVDPTIQLKWDNICAEQETFLQNLADDKIIKTQVKGHFASVDALLLVPFHGERQHLLVSGSRDRTVGLWDPHAILNAGPDAKQAGLLKKYDNVHKVWIFKQHFLLDQ